MSVALARRPDDAAEPTRASAWGGRAGRAVLRLVSGSLKRRIIALNLAGLVALLLSFLTLNTFKQSLIEARIQSLTVQGDIIAGAIAASAVTAASGGPTDLDIIFQQEGAADDTPSQLEFSINPERVGPILKRLVSPTGSRARLFDRDGTLTLDSNRFPFPGDLAVLSVRPRTPPDPSVVERLWRRVIRLFGRARPRAEDVGPSDGRTLQEVEQALGGAATSTVRDSVRGETIVSVAVPIRRLQIVQGALLLSTQGGAIDSIIASERFALLQTFLLAAVVMLVLSYFLANGIAGPVRLLAEAAERVRHGIKSREEIPDFTARTDEIGHLSGAIRDMTEALYSRIDAIESFAADVSHELKNPLTSLRSAVETLPLARSAESRNRLLEIIQHDVRRLDRLITDIADSSRLDAELVRADAEPIDMRRLLHAVVAIANERRRADDPRIALDVREEAADDFTISGHDSRLGQVVSNLFDNARSFSPPGSTIEVSLSREQGDVVVTVEDQGPGIPPHALERVFERFYTDRPDQGFGQNSGLGLSISRQIVEAHRGTIRAANRAGGEGTTGARFTIRLPTDEAA